MFLWDVESERIQMQVMKIEAAAMRSSRTSQNDGFVQLMGMTLGLTEIHFS